MDWLSQNFQFGPLDTLTKYSLIILNCFTIIILWCYKKLKSKKPTQRHPVLFVTAHPDDQAMFFQPTINELKSDYIIHLLCLSGNEVRQKELFLSAECLGIQHTKCITSEKLVDGLKEKWDQEEIKEKVREYVRGNGIKAVFTFDGYGVSGHPNHIAISRALQALQIPAKTETSVKLYQLQSVNLLRKYSSIIDLVWSMLSDFLFTKFNILNSLVIMSIHKSQFVLHRKLFMVFSRYSLMNTYKSPTHIQI